MKEELPTFRLVPVKSAEANALKWLAKELDLSEEKVFIQALRLYQLCIVRGYLPFIEKKERQFMRRQGLTLKESEPCMHEGYKHVSVCNECGYEEEY